MTHNTECKLVVGRLSTNENLKESHHHENDIYNSEFSASTKSELDHQMGSREKKTQGRKKA